MNRVTILLALSVLYCSNIIAQHGHPVTSFNPNTPNCAFDEMNQLAGAENPRLEQETLHFLREVLPRLASGVNRSSEDILMSIPVVFHIIHGGEAIGQGRNISNEQISAQLKVLNQEFSALNPAFYKTPSKWLGVAGGANIQFCAAVKDPAGNATTGIMRYNMEITGTSWNSNNINSMIKPAIRWDPYRYLNIYVLAIPGTSAAGGVVGYSNYPLPSQIGSDQDGIVIDYRWFGGPGFAVSGWSTATHEAGHYLGLPHPFEGNSCNADDGISDTPNVGKSTRDLATLDCENGFPAGPVSCDNEHMYVNFMDYVTENCYTSFTKGQNKVMRAVLDGTSAGYGYGSRASLINSTLTRCNLLTNDAGLTRLLSPENITCTQHTITPAVTLRNFGAANLTSVLIIRRMNNNLLDTFLWSGNLIPGANTDVSLRSFTPPNGINKLSIYTARPNGGADQDNSNDTLSTNITTYVIKPVPLIEDFENETAFPTSEGVFGLDISADGFKWQLSSNASGFGKGQKSAMFDNGAGSVTQNPFGTIDGLITPYLDFSGKTNMSLMFDVAYAPDGFGYIDSLFVMAAGGCSPIFSNSVYRKGGATLGTAPSTIQAFVPTSSQWRTETIDLSAYDGNPAVAIAFVNASGWGSRLYVDNIRIGKACSTLAATITSTPTACNACNGEASVQVSGGNGAYQYVWSYAGTGQGSATLKDLCAGQVTVTITDFLGCTLTKTATIAGKAKPAASVSVTHESSFGANNGTASVVGSGGTPPYSFSWSTGATGSSISNLNPGPYWVKITDLNQCDTTINFSIQAFNCAAFGVTAAISNVSCNGGANGSVSANPSGTGPFTYLWNNGNTTQSISSLSAGVYNVTVTNASNCTSTASFTLSQPPVLNLNTGVTHETAFNAKNGTATASASGGTSNYNYAWSNGATGSFISNLSPGVYTVTATDAASCTKTGTVTVNAYSCGNFASSISGTNVKCFGLATGMAKVTVSGGMSPYSFGWSNGMTSAQIDNLPAGTYHVTVNDLSGCTSTHSIVISHPPALAVNAVATPVSGPGKTDGTASASPSGGTPAYSFKWSNGGTTAAISNLLSGNYTVTITDNSGCTAVQTVSVGGTNCTLSIMVAATTTSCSQSPEGSAEVTTVSGATGNLTYKWSNGSNSFYITGLIAGMYSVTVTDGTGCATHSSVEVKARDNVPPVLILKSADFALDASGKVAVNPTVITTGSTDNCGALSFTVTPSTFNCSNLGNQTVTVKATDGSGNSTSGTVSIRIVDTLKPTITCPLNITQSACNTVLYTQPAATDNCNIATLTLVSGKVSGSAFQLGTTKVSWRALDFSGNESTCSFDVTVGNALNAGIVSITHATNSQANGKIDYSISGGMSPYALTWLRNGTPVPAFNPMQALPGNYQLVVSDAGGCTAMSAQFTVENLTSSNEKGSNYHLSLYPNPVIDVLLVEYEFPKTEHLKFTTYDLLGRSLFENKTNSAKGSLLMPEFGVLKPGVYWLKVDNGERVIIKKVMKL